MRCIARNLALPAVVLTSVVVQTAMATEPGEYRAPAANPFPNAYASGVYPAAATSQVTADIAGRSAPSSAGAPLPIAPPSTDAHDPAHGSPRSRQLPAVATAGASLGIVLGLFMLVMWVVRRGGPRDGILLPPDAVEVLGRALLVGRQQVHLVRCGNKVLLLGVTPTAVQTLTEITDPAEVERLLDLCQAAGGAGSPLRQILERFGHSSRDRHFANPHEAPEFDFSKLDVTHHHAAEPVS